MLLQKAVFTRLRNGCCSMYRRYTSSTEVSKLLNRNLHIGLRFEEIERHTIIRENKPLFLRVMEEMPALFVIVDLDELNDGPGTPQSRDMPSRREVLSNPVNVVQTVTYVRMIGENVTNGHASSVFSLLVVEFLELGFGGDVEIITILDDEVSDRRGLTVDVDLDECLA